MVRRATRLLGLTLVLAAAQALAAAATAFAAGPIGMVCTNGPSFTLNATTGTIETPDGNSVLMWSYGNAATGGAFQEPGPVLCVNQGATVTVTLNNTLSEPTSIVFPGQDNVTASGGAAGLFTREAAPGGSVTYTFTASQPGTYLYESGTDPSKQVEMGLYGALVVRPAGHPDWAYNDPSTQFDPSREYLLIFHEIDSDLHHNVEFGEPYDFNALHFRYFMVTGRSFPDTIDKNGVGWLPNQPYGSLVRVKPYDAVTNPLPALVRMVNAGLANHPFHPHGFHVRVIAQDGRMFLTPGGGDASTEHFGDVVASGSSQDSLFKFVDKDKFCEGTACTAAGWASKPLPVAIPSYRNLTFKDNVTWYASSPYLGQKGTLPTLVVSYNVCGEFYFPWHSHALNEFVNYDAGFGGLATLLRVDPLVGCTGFTSSTKINTGGGTIKGGSYASLTGDDAAYYEVNSTTVAPFKADWYGGFSGVAQGATNLKVSYKGKCSLTCNQTVSIYNWRTASWVQLDPASPATRPVGPADVAINDVAVPPSPAAGSWTDYVGTGANAGLTRVRILATRGGTFISSGNFMKLVYDAP
jgi:multicopper oxidase